MIQTDSSSTRKAEEITICPDCNGEGYFIYDGGPGRFDSSYGNWLPVEIQVPCDRCDCEGIVDEFEHSQ